jgi:hypothetical protein
MPKYSLSLFMPKGGKVMIPTPLVTGAPFDRCPSCEGDRDEVDRTGITFVCGMKQSITIDGDFAVSAYCPYAMAAVFDLRMKRLSRANPNETPATLATFSPAVLKVSDRVKWVSQSAGRETVKKGVIVALVPPAARPEDYIPDGMRRNSTNGYGRSRPHTTYLVKVIGKGSMVYWPRVHCLEQV